MPTEVNKYHQHYLETLLRLVHVHVCRVSFKEENEHSDKQLVLPSPKPAMTNEQSSFTDQSSAKHVAEGRPWNTGVKVATGDVLKAGTEDWSLCAAARYASLGTLDMTNLGLRQQVKLRHTISFSNSHINFCKRLV